MKNLKKYNEFVNENSEKWKEILKPKPYDKVIQDLDKLNLSPQKKFEVACKNGILPIVKELLKDERVDPSDNDDNYTIGAIGTASANGHVEVVKELLKDKRVNPADNQNYSIEWSSHGGHVEVVKELLKDDRVNPSSCHNFPLQWSSRNGHVEVVKELLKDERINLKYGWTDLVFIIQKSLENGHIKVVKELLKDERIRKEIPKEKLEVFEKKLKNI